MTIVSVLPIPHTAAALLLIAAALLVLTPVPVGLDRLGDRPGRRSRVNVQALAVQAPRRFVTLVAAAAAIAGAPAGGPVAALLCAIYAALLAHGIAQRSIARLAAAEHARDLDDLSALAADLRAGARNSVSRAGGRLGDLTAAAGLLAERIGAPTADLIDRIEADARAADRTRARAAAEAAGTKATALLLALLPAGGVLLGYGIGADPLHVLLHTPLGAACGITAALLQTGGVLWANRLARGPVT
jgi:tight adherence protein B